MSEESVKWLRDLAPGAVIRTDTLVDRLADLLSAIDDRDAEIERLNRLLRNHPSLNPLVQFAPTLAEVAKELYVRWVTDATHPSNWKSCAVDAIGAAKSLLAELERRGAKCK